MRELHRLALELHSLDGGDRSWVLAQLAPEERSRIERLLAAPDTPTEPRRAADRARSGNSPDDLQVDPEPSGATRRSRIDTEVDPRRLAEIVADEPDAVVATLILMEPTLGPRLLKALPRRRRREIDSRMQRILRRTRNRGEFPPALRRALTTAVMSRSTSRHPGTTLRDGGFEAALASEQLEASHSSRWRRFAPWGR